MSRNWIDELLGGPLPADGERVVRNGRTLVGHGGICRDVAVVEKEQAQTRDTFAFKWGKRDTYQSPAMRDAGRAWLFERYGDLIEGLAPPPGYKALVLDAGCGGGYSASLLFERHWPKLRYVGADISEAINVAAESLYPFAKESLFMQADLTALPFREAAFDLVLSEGALHHTPSTRAALMATAKLVRPGGLYAIYVYAKKAPAREFTDEHIRSLVSDLKPEQAWDLLMPLTKLGKALGEINAEINVSEEVVVLGIPKGRINVQRLFYWYICKLYYRPEFTLDEMNHVNFDWFMPKYAHRQTPDEVQAWCTAAGLKIERLKVEEAGITVVARRPRT